MFCSAALVEQRLGPLHHGRCPPLSRSTGAWCRSEKPLLDRQTALALVKSSLDAEHFERYQHTREANYAIHREGFGRFRVSAFWQQDLPGMVLRRIETRIPTFDELVLPPYCRTSPWPSAAWCCRRGHGRRQIHHRRPCSAIANQHGDGHILTVEDPVEFVHQHGRCLVTQREVGIDTGSFDVALRNSLRQAPDVI